ncbi:MAG: serine/threonine protein kinase [Verrucomicrobiales bacterium]|jgi:serine/threonine protein kinase
MEFDGLNPPDPQSRTTEAPLPDSRLDLAKKLENGPLAKERAIELTREIAKAVGAAHRAGIVHGNLKVSNILLTLNGKPKITGFAVRNSGVDARADVFALGELLFHLLTGAPPDADWKKARQLSWAVRRVIDRAIQPRPEDRFPDGEAFAASLSRAWIPRRRVLLMAGAAAFGGLGLAAGARWLMRDPELEAGEGMIPISSLSSEGLTSSTHRFGLIVGIPMTGIRGVAARAKSSGVRLEKLRMFRTGNQDYFATLWVRDDADWKFSENISSEKLAERNQQQLADGFEPVDFGPTMGRGFSCAVWREKPQKTQPAWSDHEFLWVWEEDRESALKSLQERGLLVRSIQFHRDSDRWRHFIIAAKPNFPTAAPKFFAGVESNAPKAEIEGGLPIDLCLGGPAAETLTAIWSERDGPGLKSRLVRAKTVIDHQQECKKLADEGWEPVTVSAQAQSEGGAVACASLWTKST